MPHAVAFEEQREIERAGRHRFEIIGAVEEGGAVEIGRADLAQRLEEIVGSVFGAVEHQMLEQMGEARLARGLVLRPDAVPHRHRDDRRLTILVHDDAQAIVEREGFVGNIDRFDEVGGRRGRRGFGERRSGGDERGRQGKGDDETMETSHENPLDQGTQANACSKSGAGRHCINGLGQRFRAFKADRNARRWPSARPDRTARASIYAPRTAAPDHCNAGCRGASSRRRTAGSIRSARARSGPTSRT